MGDDTLSHACPGAAPQLIFGCSLIPRASDLVSSLLVCGELILFLMNGFQFSDRGNTMYSFNDVFLDFQFLEINIRQFHSNTANHKLLHHLTHPNFTITFFF